MSKHLVLLIVCTLLCVSAAQAQLFDVTNPDDPIVGYPEITGAGTDWPAGEAPPLAIDNQVSGFKYLHFKVTFDDDNASGFRVTPSGPKTLITALNFASANDAVERDPIAFKLSGSDDSIDGPFTLIAEGTIDEFNEGTAYERNTWISTPVLIANGKVYDHYELLFTELRDFGAANSMQIGEVELLSDGSLPGKAGGPQPEDGTEDVVQATDISWLAGSFAAEHDVYLGTDFDDVNNATTADAIYMGRQEATTYDPGILTLGETYYWRIDEVNSPPDQTIFKGEIWSFSVEPVSFAIPIGDVTATASSVDGLQDPSNTVNGLGLNENDEHTNLLDFMWSSAATDAAPWIQFEFAQVEKLDKVNVWNHNTQTETILGFGIKEAQIEASVDGETWSDLGTVELPQAAGLPTYTGFELPMDGTVAKYIKVTALSNWSLLGLPQKGLSEVRFYAVPTRARRESPADGATGQDPLAALSWRPGREAAKHEVLVGTDPEALTLVATVDDPAYTASVELDNTVYWQVNEVNEAMDPATWEGNLWSFDTAAFVTVDDMESYKSADGSFVWETWTDGFGDNNNGALLGHNGDDMETDIVYEGTQSLPYYLGQGGASASEAVRDINRDWSEHGIISLSLMFHGSTSNVAGQMYIKVNDEKIATYPVAADLTLPQWQAWTLDLPASALGLVSTLAIGFEGGSGMVLIDAVRLYAKASEQVTPVVPDDTGLMAHYAFEGNYNDASGSGLNGAPVDSAAILSDPVRGQVLSLDGVSACVDLGASDVFNFPASFSLAAWANIADFTTDWGHVLIGKRGESDLGWQLRRHSGTSNLAFTTRGTDGADDPQGTVNMESFFGEWIQVTAVYDAEAGQRIVYVNGLVDVAIEDNGVVASTDHNTYIGGRATSGNDAAEATFSGMLDEVRVYNRALTQAEALGLAERTEPIFKEL